MVKRKSYFINVTCSNKHRNLTNVEIIKKYVDTEREIDRLYTYDPSKHKSKILTPQESKRINRLTRFKYGLKDEASCRGKKIMDEIHRKIVKKLKAAVY